MSTIDLASLPAPTVIEELDFETFYQEGLTGFRALMGNNWNAELLSDPVVKLLERAAYEKVMTRARINDAAKSQFIAFAQGADLDQLAANYNVKRLVIVAEDLSAVPPVAEQLESDESLAERTLLAFEGMAVAGPAGAYEFHARSADGRVADVKASSPSPATVLVSVLSRVNGGVATQDLLNKVAQALTPENIRPVGDRVLVKSAELVDYEIEAVLYMFPGAENELALAQAKTSLDTYINAQRRLGRDIRRSAIHAALHVSRVQRVELVKPAADYVIEDHQASNCIGSTVVMGGTDE
ncbi:baseplate J/gp47 family protein [Pseudomonas putida]|uniref:baseplate assembly protein n=1 Tax=Pseudomonas putida TaxID=303 RepID=UPI001EF9870B|nr:baseplate J/gp47 family protein [Pseudomonas putida]ULL06128.1 baseplate J/gp47 family protein [Pseudomonas putida]